MRSMSRDIGSRLPSDLVSELSKESPRPSAIPLISVDQDGLPHVALLSYFELFLLRGALHFFIHKSSRSTTFLRTRRSCNLAFVHADYVYYVKGRARWLHDYQQTSVFRLQVESIMQDFPTADEQNASLKHGIRFEGEESDIQDRKRLREKIKSRSTGRAKSPVAV